MATPLARDGAAESAARPLPPAAPLALGRGPRIAFRQSADLLTQAPSHFSPDELSRRLLTVADEASTWIALDQHRPLLARENPFALSSLVNEDEELSPGFHRVVAFERKEGELRFQPVFVTVETRPAGSPRAKGCVLFLPGGTYNGEAASAAVELLAVPLEPHLDEVEFVVRGSKFRAEGTFEAGRVALLEHPPSGDLVVQATCRGKGGTAVATHRIITVNRETEPKKDEP